MTISLIVPIVGYLYILIVVAKSINFDRKYSITSGMLHVGTWYVFLFVYNVEKLAMVKESNCRVLVFLLFYNILGAVAGVSFLSSVKIAKIYS